MSKVLILNGSARKNGNSVYLINQMKAIIEKDGKKLQILNLHQFNIKPCKGCFWCYKDFPLRCIQDDDDMNSLYPQIMEAEIIVFASPIYWFNYSGQMKIFIDRLVALHVKGGHKLDGKKFAAVFVYGDSNAEGSGVHHAINSVKHFIAYMRGETLGIVHGTASDIGDAKKNTKLVTEVQELAKKIAEKSNYF